MAEAKARPASTFAVELSIAVEIILLYNTEEETKFHYKKKVSIAADNSLTPWVSPLAPLRLINPRRPRGKEKGQNKK